MSTRRRQPPLPVRRARGSRQRLLTELAVAGRKHSDVVVAFHKAVASRLRLGETDHKVLGLLQTGEATSPGELARAIGLAPASTTAALDRLENAGYLARTRDPADGRRQVISIDQSRIGGITELFAGLMSELSGVYDAYTDEELAIILDWLVRASDAQRRAAEALRTPDAPGTNDSR